MKPVHPRFIASLFTSYTRSMGFYTKETIVADGKLHYVHLETHYNPKSKRGWYRLYPEGYGEFGIDRNPKKVWYLDREKQALVEDKMRMQKSLELAKRRRLQNGWK